MSQANRKPIIDDPIHLAIERHRNAARLWAAAVAPRRIPDSENPMTLQQQRQIDAAVSGARLPLIDAGLDLIATAPTTIEGIVAALQYVRLQLESGDVDAMPQNIAIGNVGDATIGWLSAFVDTLCDASIDILAQHQETKS